MERLHESLKRELDVASEETIQSGGRISTERLELLVRLTELCRATQPPVRRRRWPMSIALLGTLALVSLLLFARVAETEIELELTVSELGFVSTVRQVLVEDIELTGLGVSGLQAIQLPRTRTQAASLHQAPTDAAATLNALIAPISKGAGTVTLSPLMLPGGTYTRIRYLERPREYRLSFEDVASELRASIGGKVQVKLVGEAPQILELTRPKAIRLKTGAGEVDLDLALGEGSRSNLSSQLLVEGLRFYRIDEFVAEGQSIVRHASTIHSGILHLESLNGRKHVLRPHESLRFTASRGEIRTLRLADEGIALQFNGLVHGMNIGSAGSPRSLMPTYLEWLQARQPLSLLWGTTLYLFGLGTTVYRWWSKTT